MEQIIEMNRSEFSDRAHDDIKIVKKIAQGMMGTVFSAQCAGAKLIVKVSKILPQFLEPKNEVWRELEFYTNFARKHKKELLLYSIDHKVIKDCNSFKIAGKTYKHPAPDDVIEGMPAKNKKIHMQLKQSDLCLINIMPRLDGKELKHHIERIKFGAHGGVAKAGICGWFLDILKQLKVLHSNGYSHNDIHPGNVMVLDGGRKSTASGKKSTAPGRATLIDYGLVDCKKWSKKQD
jgi:serine/threonine protein kinase